MIAGTLAAKHHDNNAGMQATMTGIPTVRFLIVHTFLLHWLGNECRQKILYPTYPLL